MAKAYSIDLTKRIIEAYQNKEGSMRQLAQRFKVSKEFILKLSKRFNQTGSVDPKAHGGGQEAVIKTENQYFIRDCLKEQPDLILEEIREEYNKHFEQNVCRSTIDRALKKMNLTRQKKTLFDPRKNTPENQEKLKDYQLNLALFEPEPLIYIDEMGAIKNITRGYARSIQGSRANCANSITPGTRVSQSSRCFRNRWFINRVLLRRYYGCDCL